MGLVQRSDTPKLGVGVLLSGLAIALFVATLLPAITANTKAGRVLGQARFDSNSIDAGSQGLFAPRSLAVDRSASPNHLFVADTKNNRVLGYQDAASFASGAPADIVIGQGSFCSTQCNAGGQAGAGTLCSPSGVAVDSDGNLYVADTGNHRVLEYDDPFTVFGTQAQSVGFAARRVIGQPDFNSARCNLAKAAPGAEALCAPLGVAVDDSDRLYVADTANNRVLRYERSSSAAELVIGQRNFSSFDCNHNASGLCQPDSVAVDSHGNLFVGDEKNNRILEYNAPDADGPSAALVFGQPNFGSTAAAGCGSGTANAKGLCHPQGIAIDDNGNLFVADSGNSRVLEFENPLAVGGRTAAVVYGHRGSFTATGGNDGGLDADSLSSPGGVAIGDSGNVYIADTGNNRVLQYGAATPSSTITPATAPPPPPPAAASCAADNTSAEAAKPVAQATAAPVGVSTKTLGLGRAVFFTAGADTNTKKITLTNKTAADISDTLAIDSSSVNPSDFAAVDNATTAECNGTIAAKKKCAISVSFTPTGTGVRKAILDIEDSSGNILNTVNLTATGFSGKLTFKPTAVAFGAETRGSTKTKTLTISSTYDQSATINTLNFTNPDYTVDPSSACGLTLPATVVKGSPCVITLDFIPFPAGKDNGTLQIVDDAAGKVSTIATGNEQDIKLTGSGTGAAPPPTQTPVPTNTPLPTPAPAATCTSNGDCTDTGTICQTSTGTCVCATPGLTDCGPLTGCTDLTSDPNNCSACGSACPSGDICSASTCSAPTPAPTPAPCTTNSQCTDPGTSCQSGACACNVATDTDCGATTGCTDTTSDNNNCGTCGNACTGGNTCQSSTCAPPAPTPTPAGELLLSPNRIPFTGVANAQINGTPFTAVVTLANDQNNVLNIMALPITVTTPPGATAEWTDAGDTCGINPPGTTAIPAFGRCTITVEFAPSVGGVQIANLSVTSDFVGLAPNVQLVGNAPVPATPAPTPGTGGVIVPPTINPKQLQFTGVQEGTTSAEQTVTFINNSTSASLNVTDTISSPFATVDDNCANATIPPMGKCTVGVTFSPAGVGLVSGSLTFSDEASTPTNPQSVGLQGFGVVTAPTPTPVAGQAPPPPTLSPNPLNFGAVTSGTTSTKTITVTNKSNLLPLTISAITISSTGGAAEAALFTETDTCAVGTGSVPPSGQCVISVTFAPIVKGFDQAVLTLTDNATSSSLNPQSVALTGNGD